MSFFHDNKTEYKKKLFDSLFEWFGLTTFGKSSVEEPNDFKHFIPFQVSPALNRKLAASVSAFMRMLEEESVVFIPGKSNFLS